MAATDASPGGDQQPPDQGLPHTIYEKSAAALELRQSEILSDLTRYLVEFPDDPMQPLVSGVPVKFSVVVSQDCDLMRDFEARRGNVPVDSNSSVLICEAEPSDAARKRISAGSDIWKRIVQNNDERYHFLEELPKEHDLQGEGQPGLVLDFRRVFSVSTSEIYRQIGLSAGPACRRCSLRSPYREHLQSRLAFYLLRVALPEPHKPPPRPAQLQIGT
jgi:hypothetical protein